MSRRALLWIVWTLPAWAEAGSKAPTYTNDDLARVAPRRGETGVLSEPGARPAPEATKPREDRADASRPREAYWRREADRLRERLRPLEKQAASLRRRIDERWRLPGVAPSTDPQLITWRRELRETEAEIKEHTDRVEDRARREGALAGWLR